MDAPRLFISVVSHNHEALILDNKDIIQISKLDFATVVIKDNCQNLLLEDFCKEHDLIYLDDNPNSGFGQNNNLVFKHCQKHLGLRGNDLFLLMNPDVQISSQMICSMYEQINCHNEMLWSIDLYKDNQFTRSDDSVRYFPTIFSLFKMISLQPVTKPYIKAELIDKAKVDWAAGSFLLIKAEAFLRLDGFDERFFMYYEDVDFCYRFQQCYGQKVHFLKHIKAVHKGAFNNRNIFSTHFRWYLMSLFRFCFYHLIKGRKV